VSDLTSLRKQLADKDAELTAAMVAADDLRTAKESAKTQLSTWRGGAK
jgi:hypothetical protein